MATSVRRKLILVMGTGHCGSTLTDLILSSHSDVMGLGELISLRNVDWNDPNLQICGVCQSECTHWDQMASLPVLQQYFSLPSSRLKRLARKVMGEPSLYPHLFKWFNKPVLVDSSKNLSWIKKQIRAAKRDGIQVYLLYVVRDGRAVANSYFRKYPEQGIEVAIRKWSKSTVEMDAFFNQYEDTKYLLRYEMLCKYPAGIVGSLCALLEIDYQPSMLEYWKHSHHVIGGNTGTRSLIESARVHSMAKFYTNLEKEPAIKLDLRWRREFSTENLDAFEQLTGELNRLYAYDE